ncbi:MAG TPA: hypothetical protein VL095_05220 [Flavisolibacter sp.]|nr:hypothetical protein [Flavisolibacter sp.]
MKKRFLVAAAILTASASFAQQKKQPPPPPAPPPFMDVRPVPPPPPPPVTPHKQKADLSTGYRTFLKRNPTVKSVGWSDNKVHIHLKSGKEEVYNLNDTEQMQHLKDKYGELPVAPPPPPPKAPKIISES